LQGLGPQQNRADASIIFPRLRCIKTAQSGNNVRYPSPTAEVKVEIRGFFRRLCNQRREEALLPVLGLTPQCLNFPIIIQLSDVKRKLRGSTILVARFRGLNCNFI
jgi:hypothetical protein